VVSFVDETSLKIQTSRGEKEYEMDTVFNQKSTQEEVFEDTKRLVESFMDGFNVCLFAYGQTGSGKTFTMTGSPSEPGLTPRAVEEIFHLIGTRQHCDCKVTTYFVELYNDQLVDLFRLVDEKESRDKTQPPHLDIKLDNNKMVYIRGAVVKEAQSPEVLLDLFTKGNAERHTGATLMNAESSRSHSIFSILVCYSLSLSHSLSLSLTHSPSSLSLSLSLSLTHPLSLFLSLSFFLSSWRVLTVTRRG
jgi:hypothetical protein